MWYLLNGIPGWSTCRETGGIVPRSSNIPVQRGKSPGQRPPAPLAPPADSAPEASGTSTQGDRVQLPKLPDTDHSPNKVAFPTAALPAPAASIDYNTLANSPDRAVRRRVAESHDVPDRIMLRLVQDPDREVRVRVARNIQSPPNVLALLAQDRDAGVRVNVASNCRWLPVMNQISLSRDREAAVRMTMAANDDTPPGLLATFVHDPESAVRAALTRNFNISAELLAQLGQDPDPWIRCAVAQHHRTPRELLAQLARQDPEPLVREAAYNNQALHRDGR